MTTKEEWVNNRLIPLLKKYQDELLEYVHTLPINISPYCYHMTIKAKDGKAVNLILVRTPKMKEPFLLSMSYSNLDDKIARFVIFKHFTNTEV